MRMWMPMEIHRVKLATEFFAFWFCMQIELCIRKCKRNADKLGFSQRWTRLTTSTHTLAIVCECPKTVIWYEILWTYQSQTPSRCRYNPIRKLEFWKLMDRLCDYKHDKNTIVLFPQMFSHIAEPFADSKMPTTKTAATWLVANLRSKHAVGLEFHLISSPVKTRTAESGKKTFASLHCLSLSAL